MSDEKKDPSGAFELLMKEKFTDELGAVPHRDIINIPVDVEFRMAGMALDLSTENEQLKKDIEEKDRQIAEYQDIVKDRNRVIQQMIEGSAKSNVIIEHMTNEAVKQKLKEPLAMIPIDPSIVKDLTVSMRKPLAPIPAHPSVAKERCPYWRDGFCEAKWTGLVHRGWRCNYPGGNHTSCNVYLRNSQDRL